jgi:hypothetical protein
MEMHGATVKVKCSLGRFKEEPKQIVRATNAHNVKKSRVIKTL